MQKDSIGNRMKQNYELRSRYYLIKRMPVIIRLDGRSFTKLTKLCEKPFDYSFGYAMEKTASYLLDNIQGAKCAYKQSDEISILVTDFDTFTTEAWFDYCKSKIESVSAGMASVTFSEVFGKIGVFDSRAFNIPKEEVCNYFIWRQQDWVRNSISLLAGSLYSQKELYGKNNSERMDMIYEKGKNWASLDGKWRNGVFILKNTIMDDIIFTKDRDIIEDLLIQKEE